MAKKKLTRVVVFRLDDENYAKLEYAAKLAGVDVNDWARNGLVSLLDEGQGLTPGEWVLFVEMARLHYLIGNGFQSLADETLSPDEWQKFKRKAIEKSDELANSLLSKIKTNQSGGLSSW